MGQVQTPETFRALLGLMPTPAPLATTVLEERRFDGHTRRLVEYGTEADGRVQAYLLLPHGQTDGRQPGILAIHQDGARRPYQFGKSEPAGAGGDPELAYGLELCLQGYVVICPDRLPFESRSLAASRFRETFERFRIFIPSLQQWGDEDDLLAGLAPRPFLETVGDPETPTRVAELTGKARARYAALGAPERYEYITYDGGHVFRRDMRERSYAWLDRWLKETPHDSH